MTLSLSPSLRNAFVWVLIHPFTLNTCYQHGGQDLEVEVELPVSSETRGATEVPLGLPIHKERQLLSQ